MNIEVYKGRDGQYYCRLKASNGEIIFWSEGYTRKENAVNAANWVKMNASKATITEL
jgi:uncharacterized protein